MFIGLFIYPDSGDVRAITADSIEELADCFFAAGIDFDEELDHSNIKIFEGEKVDITREVVYVVS